MLNLFWEQLGEILTVKWVLDIINLCNFIKYHNTSIIRENIFIFEKYLNTHK